MADIGTNLGAPDATGGIVQANTDRIARQLLGDDLVNQYGDTMGARTPTFADRIRDFGSTMAGGPEKTQSLKNQARTAYQDARYKAAQTGLVQARIARAKGIALADAIKTAQEAPTSQRKQLFSAMLDEQGLDHSPAVAGLFMHEDILGSRSLAAFDKGLRDGSISIDDAATTLGSPKAALDYLGKLRANDQADRKVAADVHRDNVRASYQQEQHERTQETAARSKAAHTFEARRAAYVDKSFGRVKVGGGKFGKMRSATTEELGAQFDAAHAFERKQTVFGSPQFGETQAPGLFGAKRSPIFQGKQEIDVSPPEVPDPLADSEAILGLQQ